MGIMSAVVQSEVQGVVISTLLSGVPPEPDAVMERLTQEVGARGYSLAESGLQGWGRKVGLELGSLLDGVNRRLGSLPGSDLLTSDRAQRAVTSIIAMRAQGVGPDSWELWLNSDLVQSLAGDVVQGAIDRLPVPAIAGNARGIIEAVSGILAATSGAEEEGVAEDLGLSAEELGLPRVSGTGSFGSVAFEVGPDRVMTWREASRGHKGLYATHKVLGAMPRSEFLSPDITPTKLTVRLDAGYGASPVRDAEELIAMCREGRVERLILGGRNLGQHYIEEINEVWKRMGPGGVVLVSDLEMTLKEYE